VSRVDFYKLGSQDNRSRWVMACRLVEKAYAQGHTVIVHTASAADSQAIDDLLWTFRQGSFVPHARVYPGNTADSEAPVRIGESLDGLDVGDVLVNLGHEIPPGYDRYARILELVDQDEAVRQHGRNRYRLYRAAGHELHDHEL